MENTGFSAVCENAEGMQDSSSDQRQPSVPLDASTFFKALFEDVSVGIAITDLNGTLVQVNAALCALLGGTSHDIIGTALLKHDVRGPSATHALVDKLISGTRRRVQFERAFSGADDKTWWGRVTLGVVRDADNAARYLNATIEDVSDQRRTHKALRVAESKYRSIFENAVEGIFQTTPEGYYINANPALARIYGYETPKHLMDALSDIGRQLYVDPGRRALLRQLVETKGVVRDFISKVRRFDGEEIWISENVRAVKDHSNHLKHFEGTVEDITERKRAEEQRLHDALYDPLTELPNRTLILDRLGHTIHRAERRQVFDFAVLFIDCDKFKLINDGLGHWVGDALLRELAGRLEHCLRGVDSLARVGGDEFVIIAEEVEDAAKACMLADRIHAAFAEPLQVGDHELYVSVSIGITMADDNAKDAADMVRDADIAMIASKTSGRGGTAAFEPDMHQDAASRFMVENDLRRALERDELRVYYQPIVALGSEKPIGFEALVRWQHPDRGLIQPGSFIAIAEETGLINPIGAWVLAEACRQVKVWQDQDPANADLIISVNLAPNQLRQADIVPQITAILAETKFDPHRLKLEITESAIIENPLAAKAKLMDLKALGIQLSLDDFGTGYSSLTYLHNFPIDTIKIDRSFVQPLCENGDHAEIVRSILMLGQNLGMTVIAEGVESEIHADQLREMGCSVAQGYHYSKPVEAKLAVRLLHPDE